MKVLYFLKVATVSVPVHANQVNIEIHSKNNNNTCYLYSAFHVTQRYYT